MTLPPWQLSMHLPLVFTSGFYPMVCITKYESCLNIYASLKFLLLNIISPDNALCRHRN